jgi:hypothetical protein
MFSSSSKFPHCILVLLLVCGVIGSTVFVSPDAWAANGEHSSGKSEVVTTEMGDEGGGGGSGGGGPTDGDPDDLLKPAPDTGIIAVWIIWFVVWAGF